MAKELRFSANVPVPDSAIARSQLLAQIAPHKAAFEEAVSAILGVPFVLQDKEVTPGQRGERPRRAKLESVPPAAA